MQRIPLSAPVVMNMPARDCGEGLVNLDGLHPRVRVDDSPESQQGFSYPLDFSVRVTVAERLCRAADALPNDVALLIKETLRPLSRQEFAFNRRMARLAQEHPHLGHDQIVERTARYIAPPHVAGHPTGGAVDLTLCTVDGRELDMGCAYDDDEVESQGACFSFFTALSDEAARNRRMLFDALTREGFVNYPFEWWHWSFGDKYWAAISQAQEALYLPVAR